MIDRTEGVGAEVVSAHVWIDSPGGAIISPARISTPVEGVDVYKPGQLTTLRDNVVRLQHKVLHEAPLHAQVELLYIGRDQILVHVPCRRDRIERRVIKEPSLRRCERGSVESGCYQRPCGSSSAAAESPDCCKREERCVEANVLKEVVPDAVVRDSAAATDYKTLVSENIPGESYARREVIEILLPDFVIALLETPVCYASGERVVGREESIR